MAGTPLLERKTQLQCLPALLVELGLKLLELRQLCLLFGCACRDGWSQYYSCSYRGNCGVSRVHHDFVIVEPPQLGDEAFSSRVVVPFARVVE